MQDSLRLLCSHYSPLRHPLSVSPILTKDSVCRFRSCRMEIVRSPRSLFQIRNNQFKINIQDRWSEYWRAGVQGKLYPYSNAWYPAADIRISRQLVLAPQPILTQSHILLQESKMEGKLQSTVTWPQYIEYTRDLLNYTTHPNVSQCFFCASLTWWLRTICNTNSRRTPVPGESETLF